MLSLHQFINFVSLLSFHRVPANINVIGTLLISENISILYQKEIYKCAQLRLGQLETVNPFSCWLNP